MGHEYMRDEGAGRCYLEIPFPWAGMVAHINKEQEVDERIEGLII